MIKNVVLTLGSLLVLGGAVVLLGPRASSDTTLRAVDVPDTPQAVARHVANQEAAVADIRPGTEKTIVWADSVTKAKTPIAIVYVHGFTASRGEVHPLCDTLAARLDANVYYTRLTGHGRDADAMGRASLGDWLNDTYEAHTIGQRLGEEVLLIGTSMGGALVTWLTAQPHITDPLATVAISPAYGLKDPEAQQQLAAVADWPWAERILRWQLGAYRGAPSEDPAMNRYWTRRYRTDALIPLVQVMEQLEETDLQQINSPFFIAYSPNDNVISPAAIQAFYPAIGAARKDSLRLLQTGDAENHVIAGVHQSPETTGPVAQSILDFVQSLRP